MFKRIDHIALEVTDLTSSAAFYEKHFGFHEYFSHVTPGGTKIIYLKLGDTLLELVESPGAKIQGCHFALETIDLNKSISYLLEQGVAVFQDIHHTPPRRHFERDWRRIVFLGPDQELIEIRGPYKNKVG